MKSHKTLKQSYQEIKFKIGVFQIKNTVNHKIYIEGSTDLVSIWNRYKFQLKNGLHTNTALQKDWTEYGEENFTFEILDEIQRDESKFIDYRKDVKELEQLYIAELKPFGERGYNNLNVTRIKI